MKKRKTIVLLIIIGGMCWISLFSVCYNHAENTCKKLIYAMKSNDADVIKSLLSNDTRMQESIEHDIDELLSVTGGKIDRAIFNSRTSRVNSRRKYYKTPYRIWSNQVEYILFITQYTRNKEDPNKIGICSISILRADEKELYPEFNSGEPGIHIYGI